MRCIFAREEGNCTIGSVDVFFCSEDPKGWDMSAYTAVLEYWEFSVTNLFGLSALATIRPLLLHHQGQSGDPTMLLLI
jgi:hypothetical protein